jgi:hypothetical protein
MKEIDETLVKRFLQHVLIENETRFNNSIVEKSITPDEVEDLYIQHVETTIKDVNKSKKLPFPDLYSSVQQKDETKENFLIRMSEIVPLFLIKMKQELTKVNEKKRLRKKEKSQLLKLIVELSLYIPDLTGRYKSLAEKGNSHYKPILDPVKESVVIACKTLNYLLLEEKSIYPKEELAEIQSFWAVRADVHRFAKPEEFIFFATMTNEVGRGNLDLS